MADYLFFKGTGKDDSSNFYNIDDLLSCAVCCEQYHETNRHPVLLPQCGHSFCRPCIAFLVKKGTVQCPSCRLDQRVEGAEKLPTEFSLLAISAAQQVTKQEMCRIHEIKLSFYCKTCMTPACGECLFEDHPMTSHNVIKSTKYVEEMKDSVTKITNKFMDALDGREKNIFEKVFQCTKQINDSLRTITVLRKDMEEARDLMKGVKIVEGIASTQTLTEAAKFLGLKWNLQDVNLELKPVMSIKECHDKEEKEKESVESESESSESESESEDEDECKEGKGKSKRKSRPSETVEGEKPDVTANDENSEANEKEQCEDNKEEKTEEKADEEKKVEEEELTEEEIKKRAKLQRFKDRLAAASAAAELAKLEEEEKILKTATQAKLAKLGKQIEKNPKEKKEEPKEKKEEPKEKKELKPWQKRTKVFQPVSREPSITPEREIVASKKKDSKEDKAEDTEVKKEDSDKKDAKEKTKDEAAEKDDYKENEKESKGEGNPLSKSKTVSEISTQTESVEDPDPSLKKSDDKEQKEGKEEKDGSEQKDDGEKKEKTKKSGPVRKPKMGRQARLALKRAQTMDLSQQVAENNASEANEESENIKGLDLEIKRVKTNSECENRKTENKEENESKEETEEKVEEIKEEKVEKKKKKKKKVQKKEDSPELDEMGEKKMFEMEPEEKERIATELLQVPNLTVVIEGVGGLLARCAHESMGLHIYCHQFQELPYDIIVKSNVLHAVIPTRHPMVFMDLASENHTLGRVYITLWGHLRRAINFLLLCLGDRGRSLKDSKFFEVINADIPGERLHGGDYEYNDGRGGEALIDDLECQGNFSMPMEMGLITSASCGMRAMDSQFYICTEEDLNRQFACPFGRVTVGLPILKEAVWSIVTDSVFIEDCGVVLDCPRL